MQTQSVFQTSSSQNLIGDMESHLLSQFDYYSRNSSSGFNAIELKPTFAIPLPPAILRKDPLNFDSEDWVIDNVTAVSDREITLNGNIIIQSNGSLTLSNVTLRMNCSFNGEFIIIVENRGYLIIKDSIVTATDPLYVWYLVAKAECTLQLINSTLCYAGYEYGINGCHSGLWINSTNAMVINCSIYGNYIGIYLSYADDSLVVNNTIVNSSSHGIRLDSSYNCIAKGNIIRSSGGVDELSSGIYLHDCNRSFIARNIVTNSTFGGVWVSCCENVTISSNYCTSNNVGIYVEISCSLEISNNFCSKNSYGIRFFDAKSEILVAQNLCEQNYKEGIKIEHSYIVAINNLCITNGAQGLEVYNSDACTIANNSCSNNTENGIKLYSANNNTIANNTCAYNNISAVLVHISDDNLIAHNYFLNNTSYGVYLGANGIFPSSDNWIFNNYFANNNQGGFQAGDHGWDNVWENNYWDDHIEPDDNKDGIVDSPYMISQDIFDPHPLVEYRYIPEDSVQHGSSADTTNFKFDDFWIVALVLAAILAFSGLSMLLYYLRKSLTD